MYELNSFLCQKIWVLFPKNNNNTVQVFLLGMHIAKGMRKGNSTNEFLQLLILFITLGIFSQLEIYDGIFSVFTVMPSKTKIENHSIQKVQNLGNEGQ